MYKNITNLIHYINQVTFSLKFGKIPEFIVFHVHAPVEQEGIFFVSFFFFNNYERKILLIITFDITTMIEHSGRSKITFGLSNVSFFQFFSLYFIPLGKIKGSV